RHIISAPSPAPPTPSSPLFPYTKLFRSRPLDSGLGRDAHARAQMTLGEGLADDFFRAAESIGRGRIDEIHAVLDRRSDRGNGFRSEEHTSELQSRGHLVCRLLLEKKKKI